jgi:hypothetical protein
VTRHSSTDRRHLAGAAVLGVGLVAIVLVGRLAPVESPPLYDGVVVNDPYRWVDPPAGAKGDAKGVTDTIPVKGGQSPLLAAATPEQPPQAQIFATPGSLTLPPGTTSIGVSIQPLSPAGAGDGQPSDGHIAGNVYRMAVASQTGTPVTAPASALVSVVLRGPGSMADGTIEQFVDGAWHPLKTSASGFASTFLAVVTSFSDFAVVASGAASSTAPSAAPAASSSNGASAAASAAGPSPAGPSVAPSSSPSPTSGGGGGPGSIPVLPFVIVAVVVLGGLVVFLANRRKPPPPPRYQGARRR